MACTGTYAESAEDADPTVLQRWGVTLDWIELELDEGEVEAADFSRYEARLGALIDDVEQFKTQATQALETPRLELDALGSLPEEGEPAEASDISAQRGAINEQIAALT